MKLTPDLASIYGVEANWNYGLEAHVRWSDLDGFGHVNHRAHFLWFEDVRNAYLENLGFPLAGPMVPGPVVKETHCTYQRPLGFNTAILVTARTTWFGRSSFHMNYAIWHEGLVARGSAILVWLRNSDSTKVTLPDGLRAGMVADGAILRSRNPKG
ncbi:acyl-CoA thioesterase [Castellaniella sp.]|uniref:acyl-CoA thioesterase n=1 Tax=Castellaniella sp. TaxID=1955812 RepID=UPI00355EAC02